MTILLFLAHFSRWLLDPIDSYYTIRTNYCAISTAGAGRRILHVGEMIASGINFPGNLYYTGRTRNNTDLTPLAPFLVNYYRSSGFSHNKYSFLTISLPQTVLQTPAYRIVLNSKIVIHRKCNNDYCHL